MISGLIFGIIFGFLLKRGRFCPTGTIRDIRLEKRGCNFLLILALIATEGLIYYIMVKTGLVPEPKLKSFPLISVAAGSFIFGFGAVMTNGCITSSLIKTGDGRIIGIVSIMAFVTGASFAKQGALKPVTQVLASKMLIPDTFYKNLPVSPIIIFGIIAAVVDVLMFRRLKTHKPKFTLPKQYSGLRHIFCEKIWPKEVIMICAGVLMAAGFYFSAKTGRNGGFGITTPLVSWLNLIVNNTNSINWTSMLVLGIVLGSFFTTLISNEYSLVAADAPSTVKALIGSVLMGIGAVWGQGCLIGNGLVGTAQLSVRAWFALACIALGIWTATQIFLISALKRK